MNSTPRALTISAVVASALVVAACSSSRYDTAGASGAPAAASTTATATPISGPSAPTSPAPTSPAPTSLGPPSTAPLALRTVAPLVGWSNGGHDRPQLIAANLAVIEATPFDGMVINSPVGYLLFDLDNRELDAIRDNGGSYTQAGIAESFAPLTRASFTRMDRNLALVSMGSDGQEPPELFDDANWQRALLNAERFARQVDALGLWGIMLDNEVYSYTYWRFPEDIASPDRGAAAYVAQSRLRGRQLMEAFRRGKNDITVVAAHGPHEGCSASQSDAGTWADDAFLLGAFAAGLIEGGVAPARAIDGGELYDLRTADQFAASARWRSVTATAAGQCPFMDDSLATVWTAHTGIGFATFDHERPNQNTDDWTPITNMDTVRLTTRLASCAATDVVWAFAEAVDWWSDGVVGVDGQPLDNSNEGRPQQGAPVAPVRGTPEVDQRSEFLAAIAQGRADAADGSCT
jgi:hypothetical protein